MSRRELYMPIGVNDWGESNTPIGIYMTGIHIYMYA